MNTGYIDPELANLISKTQEDINTYNYESIVKKCNKSQKKAFSPFIPGARTLSLIKVLRKIKKTKKAYQN